MTKKKKQNRSADRRDYANRRKKNVPLISADELERAAARLREPAPASLVIVDGKGRIVQEWNGDVNQAAEIRANLPRGHRIRE